MLLFEHVTHFYNDRSLNVLDSKYKLEIVTETIISSLDGIKNCRKKTRSVTDSIFLIQSNNRRSAVALSVERPSKVPIWCNSADVGSNPQYMMMGKL